MDESQEVLPTRAAMPRAPRHSSIMPPQQEQICVSGETIAPRDGVFRRLDVDLLVAKKQIIQTDLVVTGTVFAGNIVSTGSISGAQLNISGPATVGSLVAGDIVGNNLTIANTATINIALINNASMNHATISDATINTLDVVTSLTAGNGTFEGPLYLQGNPPSTDSDLLLARNSSGAVTQTTVPVGLLTSATSGNVPNTLVLRDILGNFATNNITTNGLDVVGTSTFHDYMYTPFATVSPNNVLYVKKGLITAPNQFNSVKAAIDSITTGTGPNNPFVVSVSAGIFIEDTITLKPYVSIVGDSEFSSIIEVDSPAKDVIIGCDQAFMKALTLRGATGPGQAAVVLDGGYLWLDHINFGSNDIFVKERATAQPSTVILAGAFVLDTALTSIGFDIQSTSALPCGMVMSNLYWLSAITQAPGMTMVHVSDIGSFLNASNITVGSRFLPPVIGSGSKFLQISNGATVQLSSAVVNGFDTAFFVPSAPTGPNLNLVGVLARNNNTDVLIQDQRTVGSISGEFARSKVIIPQNVFDLSLFLTEPVGAGITMLGPLYTGRYDFDEVTNISPLLNDGASLGVLEGGLMYTTTTSLVVTVSAGSGYLMQFDPTEGENNLKLVSWATTSTSLSTNKDNFVYINNTGLAQVALSPTDIFATIPLGKVRTSGTGALFIEEIPQDAGHTATKLTESLIEAFGPIYVSGSIVTQNGIDGLSVSQGRYVYGTHIFEPIGASPLSWQAYLGAGANEFLTTQTAVDYQYFDNGGVLDLIPTGSYAKHLLYVIGGVDPITGATNEQYALVYSQTTFPTLSGAEIGSVPLKPSTWTGNIVPIASIIVQNNGAVQIAEILDERPRPGFVSSSVAGVTVHGDLQGLGADDHLQYVLTNGGRVMTGSLNLGTNQIINAGQINGVTIEGHASRHLPNSSPSPLGDPLPVGVPSTIGTANADGVLNAFARQDHIHAHGAQTDPTLHAVATMVAHGFMSSTDKQMLVDATAANTPNTLVQRDALGDFAAGTIAAGLIGNVTGNVSGVVTGNLFGNVIGNLSGNVTGNVYGNVVGNVLGNITGAASLNVLKAGDTMTGQLRIGDPILSPLVVTGNTTTPAVLVTGQSLTAAPALRLVNNPTAVGTDVLLAIDASGNVTKSTVALSGASASGTSGNTLGSLVQRNTIDGGFAAGTITATGFVGNVIGNLSGNVLGNVTGNVVGNVSGAASLNVLKAGDTMTGQLRISDAASSALVLNTNTLAPTALITGNSTTQAPALRLAGVPTLSAPATTFDATGYALTMDFTGNVIKSVGSDGDMLRTFFSQPNWFRTVEPKRELFFYDDFTGQASGTGLLNFGDTVWFGDSAGTASGISSPVPISNDIGVVQLESGTTATSRASMNKSFTALSFGKGVFVAEMRVRFNALSNGTQNVIARIGYGNTNAATGTIGANDFTNGVYFEYDFSQTTPNHYWRCKTAVSGGVGTPTVTPTTTAIAANTWYTLRIEVNAAANSAKFYVDGVLVATNTTNIPTGVNACGAVAIIGRILGAGVPNIGLLVDYWIHSYILTTLR